MMAAQSRKVSGASLVSKTYKGIHGSRCFIFWYMIRANDTDLLLQMAQPTGQFHTIWSHRGRTLATGWQQGQIAITSVAPFRVIVFSYYCPTLPHVFAYPLYVYFLFLSAMYSITRRHILMNRCLEKFEMIFGMIGRQIILALEHIIYADKKFIINCLVKLWFGFC